MNAWTCALMLMESILKEITVVFEINKVHAFYKGVPVIFRSSRILSMCKPEKIGLNLPFQSNRLCLFRLEFAFWGVMYISKPCIKLVYVFYIVNSFLKRKWTCRIMCRRSFDMFTISKNLRIFTLGSLKTISWILLIISSVVNSIKRTNKLALYWVSVQSCEYFINLQ